MKMTGLSFDNIPPLTVPLRFFLSAPLFGMLAAVLLISFGDIWVHRWHPALLALTHLLTLGVMTMVMVGALFQLMPVVSSQPIPRAQRIAPWIHLLLCAGTLSLICGFLLNFNRPLLTTALLLLACGLLCFALPLISALIRAGRAGDTVLGIRLAVFALVMLVLLGGLKLAGYQAPALLQPETIGLLSRVAAETDYHVGWAFGGWVVLLVMAVSFQVIPMFHVAPNFSRWITLGLTSALFTGLLLISVTAPYPDLQTRCIIILSCLIISYGLYSLRLIARRKRRLADPCIQFWQLGLVSLMASALGVVLLVLDSAPLSISHLQMLIGVLFIYGFAISIIEGMLQKILPFLIYMHLQRACINKPSMITELPNMKTLIPTAVSQRQLQLHCLALASLVGGLLLPLPQLLTGLLVFFDFAWLFYALFNAQQRYQHKLKQINAREQ